MKTLEELYGEIMKSEALNKAFAEALMDNKVGEFLKAHGCESDVEELAAFLRERGRQAKSVELADEALDKVSGGAYSYVGGDICQNCWNLC